MNYTWFNDDISTSPVNRYSRIEVEIPVTGNYTLMAKCFDNYGVSGECRKGYCNIYNIDSTTQVKTLLKENAQLGGYRLTLPYNIQYSDSKYNSFTANLNNCDTIMYILTEDNVNQRNVIGYNDDYTSNGDYIWGRASRINQKYISNTPRYVFVSSYFSSTSGTADIYSMCGQTFAATSPRYAFPNLKEDDAIISAPGTSAYNCFSYSGGVTCDWIEPASDILSPWYNTDPEKAFDNYYGNNPPRYIGAMTFIPTIDENESVINLYKNGDLWTHASVRKSANNQYHGYAWESKIGNSYRIFHPKNALNYDNPDSSKAYGHIEKMYKKIENNSTASQTNYSLMNDITFEKSLNDGLTSIQNIKLSESEDEIINSNISKINGDTNNEFEELYLNWINHAENISVSSISSDYIKTPEYEELSEFVDSHNELIYIIIDKYLKNSNVFNIALFNDKVVNKNKETLKLANSIREKNNRLSYRTINADVYIAPTFDTNAICFIKSILSDDIIANKEIVTGGNYETNIEKNIVNDNNVIDNNLYDSTVCP